MQFGCDLINIKAEVIQTIGLWLQKILLQLLV